MEATIIKAADEAGVIAKVTPVVGLLTVHAAERMVDPPPGRANFYDRN